MQTQHPLATITPTVDGEVLTVLARADATFTTGQLHTLLPHRSAQGIRNVLRRLAAQGVVTTFRVGAVDGYTLNRDHLAAGPIIELANLPTRLRDRIADQLATFTHKPLYAALFGSAASGQMRTDSDIDIFLVRPTPDGDQAADDNAWTEDLDRLANKVTSWTGNDARILDMTEHHVRTHAADEPVIADIARDGITIYGPANWPATILHTAAQRDDR